jgi:hypothetical protein
MVAGSRDAHFSRRAVEQRLREHLTPLDRMLCGMARGIDRFCWDFAYRLGCERVPYWPDGLLASPYRFHQRNDAMLRDCEAVLAFWDGRSRGTRSVIEKAQRKGLPLFAYSTVDGSPIAT